MPNDNLGTAHGSVLLELDDRASGKLLAVLTKMSRQFDQMNKQLTKIEKSINASDKAFESTAKSMDRATKSSKGFAGGIFAANKSMSKFIRDTNELYTNINKLNQLMEKANDWYKPISKAYITLDLFSRALPTATSNVAAFNKALGQAGVYKAFRKNALSSLVDLKGAMRDMPTWVQNLNRMAVKMAQVGAAGLLISKVAKRDIFAKFLDTKAFARIARDSEGAGIAIQEFVKKADHNFNFFSRSFNKAFKPVYEFATGAKGFIAGAALIRSGINGVLQHFELLRRIPTPILRGLALMISTTLPAALSVLSSALSITTNVLLGLLDGVKQLSGAALVIPGIFASIGAVAGTLRIVFGGLKDQFKDIFSTDPTEALEAWYKLPEHLRGIATSLQNANKLFKDMQVALQKIAFAGVEKQIDALANNYIPQMQKAMGPLIVSLRGAKDQLVGFLGTESTRSDINKVFANTASSIARIGPAIQPALTAFRDIAVVGTQFLNNLSSAVPGLVKQFSQWAAVNRANGKLLSWMQDARQGAVDLVVGLKNLGTALWSVLTIFRTNTGTGFLEDFANSMEKFNNAVQSSASVGTLREIGNSVRDLVNPSKVNQFTEAFHKFYDMMSSIWDVVRSTAEAFTAQFLPALEQFMGFVTAVARIKHALGLDEVLGTIFGLIAAFKLGDSVLKGLFNTIKAVAGVFLVLKNSSKVVAGIETAAIAASIALSKMGRVGKVAGDSLLNVTSGVKSIGGALAVLGSAISVIGLAVAGGWFAWDSANKKIEQGLGAINERSEQTKKFATDLQEAFSADKGLTGSSVVTVIDGQLDAMFSNLEHRADTMPSMLDHLGSSIDRAFSNLLYSTDLGDTDAIDSLQEMANKAQLAQAAFKEAGVTTKQLQGAISGSAGSWEDMQNRLLNTSQGGAEATAEISRLRVEFQQAAEDARRLGTSGSEVAAGIQKIAEAGGDATTKLEGLKTVLEGLGILKTSSLDALQAYEKSIRDLGSSVQEALSSGGGIDDLIDKQTGSFNVATEAGSKFYDAMKEIGQTFMSEAAQPGANVQAEYAKFTAQLDALSQQTGISRDKLIELGKSVGLVPDDVAIAVSLEGAEPAIQDMAKVLLEMRNNVGKGVEVPIGISTNAADISNKINTILGPGFTRAEGTNLFIRPGLKQEDVDKVQAALAKLGVSVSGSAAQPATIPIGTGLGKTGDDSDVIDQQKAKIDDFLGTVSDTIDSSTDEAKSAGEKFAENFAQGMLDGLDSVGAASDKLAQEARDRFHHSPPKKGPLASHGDAALYAGKVFSQTYATGLTSGAADVGGAASTVAGAASGGLKTDKMYQSGQFLGQLTQLSDFASHFVDVFDKLAQTILGFAKFASDPLGKGTFFGKSPGFRRDPAISDADLAKQNADAAQQRIFSFYGSAQRPDLYDPNTGMPKITGPGQLDRNASKSDIQAQIAAVGQAAGASKEDIAAAYAIVDQETGGTYNPVIIGKGKGGGGADAIGLFQQTLGMWGTMEELTNPNVAIQKYWEAWKKTPAGSASSRAVTTQNPGGYGTSEIERRMANGTLRELDSVLQSTGGVGPTTNLNVVPGAPGNLVPGTGPTKLKDTGKATTVPQLQALAADLTAMFPGIVSIGGSRDTGTAPGTHDTGTSIDVGIGEPTVTSQALGDQINAYIRANAGKYGLDYTIWRNKWSDFKGSAPTTVANHQNHIDVHVAGATPNLSSTSQVPIGSPYAGYQYGLPPKPEDKPSAPKNLVVRNPDGTFSAVHEGTGELPGTNEINVATGKPWTPEESAEFWNRPENAPRFDASILQGGDQDVPGVFQGTQDDLLNEVKDQTPLLRGILDGTNQQLTETEAITAATQLQTEIDKQTTLDTPASRARASALQGIQSNITSQYGLTQEENPIDKASSVVSSISGIAGDIFKVINSGIEAIGATKDITETLIRYPSNTEDIYRMIDDFQKYIKFAADIAGATSSIMGALGSFSGGMDMGAVKGASQIAAMVQAALETVNAVIDLGQEAYRIIGTYVGDFLGFLVGGQDSLRGNIKFLLDTQNNELLAYSQDNPLDKRVHEGVGGSQDTRGQLARDIYVYGGPGQDPRDNTRQMMLQIKMNQTNAPTGQ